MFRLFRRKRDRTSIMFGVFQKVGSAVDRGQRRCADYLNKKVAGLTKRQLVAGLVCFCLAFGTCAAGVILQAFHHDTRQRLSIDGITVPGHAIIPDTTPDTRAVLTEKQYGNIRSFEKYLDSLGRSPAGKVVYDSIATHRPGLIDSLALLRSMYYSPLKIK